MRSIGAAMLALALLASSARADDLTATFHAEGGAGVMLTDSYRDRFDWGFSGALRAGLEVLGPLAIQVSFMSAWFPVEGQQPGNLYDTAIGARGYFEIGEGIGGPFIDANGGVGITGDLVRFAFDAGIGWDFFPHDTFGLGPYVRYLLIVQPDDEPQGDDAHVLSFGVNLTVRVDLTSSAPVREVVQAPDPDGDGDGVPDARDGCLDEREDHDGYQDGDGCPDRDHDGDGIVEGDDRCPDAAEVRNGFEDDDGCPDEAPPVAAPSEPQIEELPQRVLFRLGSARVGERSLPPIEEVCEVMRQRPGIRIRVIGHADEQGTAAGNHRLGAERAGAVAERLVMCGVSPERIESYSHGDTRRECADPDIECQQRNRRVVFQVLTD